ncbi:putative tRNAHis guanylyltransferase [Wilcoxina mikolae CBS 423.85]|nr:putative tRNAHis guanylyltransferase [Wilcoxina mikolae CBS 423.85]
MANSKYEYVRQFEKSDNLLPNTWIVVRLDGRAFHKFTARHNFTKPNDLRALNLMNAVATAVATEIPEIVFAYGVSDEFSFVLRRNTDLFERRERYPTHPPSGGGANGGVCSKIVTTITSTFTAYYIHLWPTCFPNTPLVPPLPSFDGRAVLYPSTQNLRDYISWRQVDAHINNLYNTTFWALIQRGGMTAAEAEKELVGTLSKDKNEILFTRFGINYNNEEEMCKKGSVVFREYDTPPPEETGEELSKSQAEKRKKLQGKAKVVVRFCDVIRDAFWEERPWILGCQVGA